MVEIIIKGKEESMRRLKGRNVSEFAKNIESEGWPSEFKDEGQRDKIQWVEKKLGRPIQRHEIQKRYIGEKEYLIRKFAKERGLQESDGPGPSGQDIDNAK